MSPAASRLAIDAEEAYRRLAPLVAIAGFAVVDGNANALRPQWLRSARKALYRCAPYNPALARLLVQALAELEVAAREIATVAGGER